jgi:hypothetical protein
MVYLSLSMPDARQVRVLSHPDPSPPSSCTDAVHTWVGRTDILGVRTDVLGVSRTDAVHTWVGRMDVLGIRTQNGERRTDVWAARKEFERGHWYTCENKERRTQHGRLSITKRTHSANTGAHLAATSAAQTTYACIYLRIWYHLLWHKLTLRDV